jgi:hypothetical protein
MESTSQQRSDDIPQATRDWVAQMRALESGILNHLAAAPEDKDPRWVSIAKTKYEEGRMAAVRAVTEARRSIHHQDSARQPAVETAPPSSAA